MYLAKLTGRNSRPIQKQVIFEDAGISFTSNFDGEIMIAISSTLGERFNLELTRDEFEQISKGWRQ